MSGLRKEIAPELMAQGRQLYENTLTPTRDIATKMGLSRTTLDNRIAEWKWQRHKYTSRELTTETPTTAVVVPVSAPALPPAQASAHLPADFAGHLQRIIYANFDAVERALKVLNRRPQSGKGGADPRQEVRRLAGTMTQVTLSAPVAEIFMDVLEAVASRYSCRAFLPKPVPEKTIRDIVERAARAPSAGNMQPWRVYALAGKRVEALVALLAPRMATELPRGEGTDYTIYPEPLSEPYKARRFQVGEALYEFDWRAARGQAGALSAICAQLSILRCAGRAVFRAREIARAGTMGRHRRLPANGRAAGARLRPAHLSATGLGVV